MTALYPSRQYRRVLKKGMNGHEVAALQLLLNQLRGEKLQVDGAFGALTFNAVTAFQRFVDITVDGIAGVGTQTALGRRAVRAAESEQTLPPGLLRGIAEGESGYAIGCVNWSVPPGVDCGLVQDRVQDPKAATTERWRVAFGLTSLHVAAGELRGRHDRFYGQPGAKTHRRAWELAVLAHNYPWAAERLAAGRVVSTARAQWVVDIGVTGISSPAEWCDWYVQRMTALVTWWPA